MYIKAVYDEVSEQMKNMLLEIKGKETLVI